MTNDREDVAGPWADEDRPHDEDVSRAQIDGLIARLGPGSGRVLDLGCGAGRVLVPLAARGHVMTGVDRDEAALDRCRSALTQRGIVSGQLASVDFVADWPDLGEPFDAVICLGNTFMTVVDVDEAVAVLRAAAAVTRPEGFVAIDDFCRDFWPEVTGGNWQEGVSPDGDAQMVWSEGDAVFAVRKGDSVDTSCWTLKEEDRPLRLWSDGALRLAARAAGLSAPERVIDTHLLVMRRV